MTSLPNGGAPAVSCRGLSKRYGSRVVLDLNALDVARGELFVILGPSGSGKTTLLRILAGLLAPDAGSVALAGEDVAGVPPHRRGVGMVFQGLALWPHLSVRGNIALGLDRIVPDAAQRKERIREIAAELQIDGFLGARPQALSGGERQRVALARALARRPFLLLLDEPFGGLDARLRRSTARLVRDLHERHGMTTMLITHDRTDAYLLADRVGVFREGRLIAQGPPDRLHEKPGDPFTAEFWTDAAILRGVVENGCVRTVLGRMPVRGGRAGSEALVAVRPDEIALGEGPVAGRVVACEFAGGPWRCRIDVGGTEVVALSATSLEPGAEVRLSPPAAPRDVLEERS